MPTELERHLQLKAGRLTNYSLTREEVRLFLETRLGLKVKEPRVVQRHTDSMDVDSVQKGGKGKKGKARKGK